MCALCGIIATVSLFQCMYRGLAAAMTRIAIHRTLLNLGRIPILVFQFPILNTSRRARRGMTAITSIDRTNARGLTIKDPEIRYNIFNDSFLLFCHDHGSFFPSPHRLAARGS
jgi:hypothetical protein